MHTTLIMSLHYVVKHKYLKTNKNWPITVELQPATLIIVFNRLPRRQPRSFHLTECIYQSRFLTIQPHGFILPPVKRSTVGSRAFPVAGPKNVERPVGKCLIFPIWDRFFSRWWNMDKDSADVTLADRSFLIFLINLINNSESWWRITVEKLFQNTGFVGFSNLETSKVETLIFGGNYVPAYL